MSLLLLLGGISQVIVTGNPTSIANISGTDILVPVGNPTGVGTLSPGAILVPTGNLTSIGALSASPILVPTGNPAAIASGSAAVVDVLTGSLNGVASIASIVSLAISAAVTGDLNFFGPQVVIICSSALVADANITSSPILLITVNIIGESGFGFAESLDVIGAFNVVARLDGTSIIPLSPVFPMGTAALGTNSLAFNVLGQIVTVGVIAVAPSKLYFIRYNVVANLEGVPLIFRPQHYPNFTKIRELISVKTSRPTEGGAIAKVRLL